MPNNMKTAIIERMVQSTLSCPCRSWIKAERQKVK